MTIEKTLAERSERYNRYGSFQNHANIAQSLQDVMRSEAGWERLAADQRQALTAIADKIARMLNGDPNYRDNWHDIVGYSKLVDDRMAADELQREKVGCTGEEMEPVIEYAYSAISPEDYADGWRQWAGGRRPWGHKDTRYDVRLRDGDEVFNVTVSDPSWRHAYGKADIVAYRLSR